MRIGGVELGDDLVTLATRLQLCGDQFGHEVAVARDGALEHARLLGERLGVDQVAVVAQREHVLAHRPVGGLGVAPGRRTGRRVAAVPDREVAHQPRQRAVVEDAGDETLVLDHRELVAIADGHARRLLAAVLQREEAQVGEVGDRLPGGVHGEDAARLLGMVGVDVVDSRRPRRVRVAHGPQSAVPDPRRGEPAPNRLVLHRTHPRPSPTLPG